MIAGRRVRQLGRNRGLACTVSIVSRDVLVKICPAHLYPQAPAKVLVSPDDRDKRQTAQKETLAVLAKIAGVPRELFSPRFRDRPDHIGQLVADVGREFAKLFATASAAAYSPIMAAALRTTGLEPSFRIVFVEQARNAMPCTMPSMPSVLRRSMNRTL